jgi:hypothetical protein
MYSDNPETNKYIERALFNIGKQNPNATHRTITFEDVVDDVSERFGVTVANRMWRQ